MSYDNPNFEYIVREWNAGKTTTEIAIALSITRSAVSGIISRAKARHLITRVVIRNPPKPKLTPKQARIVRRIDRVKAMIEKKATEAPIELFPPLPLPAPGPVRPLTPLEKFKEERGKTLFELQARDCRWIKPTGFYCGRVGRSQRQPWCDHHFRIVYVPGTAINARKRKLSPAGRDTD